MNKILKMLPVVMLLWIAGCQEDDRTFGDITTPTGLTVDATVVGVDQDNPNGDGSGTVVFEAFAENAISYTYKFGDDNTEVSSDGNITYSYFTPGTNTYTVTVIANGTGGSSTTATVVIDVFSAFSDAEAIQFLTGGSSKTWYWAASERAHLGVGPNDPAASDHDISNPEYYAADPFEKEGAAESQCLYMDELVFSLNGDDLTYELRNMGQTYFNVGFESVVGGTNGFDYCYDYDTSGIKDVQLRPSNSLVPDELTRGTSMVFSDDGFMSYYIGTSEYEILSITENSMEVRGIMNGDLAWYHIFTTDTIEEQRGSNQGSLIWSEEFDVDGAPDPTYWTYDLGTGSNGWGNGEEQYYTDDPSNVVVSNGTLKITARRENFGGRNFTSARIKTQGLFDFQYGRVEVSAKLPTGGGTWPAIWMMGQDFQTVGWPECGEMDIMEHVGNDQNTIISAVHWPDPNGPGAASDNGTTTVSNVSTDFVTYEMEWNEDLITFKADGNIVYTFAHDDTLPFRDRFFFILNVAMGGNLGGTVDPAFTESTMEIDYIRVYQ